MLQQQWVKTLESAEVPWGRPPTLLSVRWVGRPTPRQQSQGT